MVTFNLMASVVLINTEVQYMHELILNLKSNP